MALMNPDTWISLRDTALAPDEGTDLVTTEATRREFLTGALLIGIIGGDDDHDPKPQQLLLADTLNAGNPLNGVLMPRRSTKTSTELAVIIGRCACRPRRNSAFTLATTGLKAREKFREEVIDPIEARYPNPKERPVTIHKSAGSERLAFPNRSVFAVHPPSGESFRSSAYDDVLVDEGGEADEDMTDDLLAAIPPTFDTTGGQLIVSGTAGKRRGGNILWRLLTEEQLRAGKLRYNAPDDTGDEQMADWEPSSEHPRACVRELIERHHPGAGNLTPLAAVERNYRLQPRDVFMREYLGIFGNEGSTSGIIPPPVWESTTERGDPPTAPARFAVAFAVHPFGLWSSVAYAWELEDEAAPDLVMEAWQQEGVDMPAPARRRRIGIGLKHHQRGTDGLDRVLAMIARKHKLPIGYDSGSQQALSVVEFKGFSPKPQLTPAKTWDVRVGATKLVTGLGNGSIRHWPHEPLDNAATIAVRRSIGEGFGFGRPKGDERADVTPLEAVALALHFLDDQPQQVDPRNVMEFA